MSKLSIKNLSPRNWIIVIASFVALICYFLPWYEFIFAKSIVLESGSGLTFAVTEMTSSGIRGAPLFATPIAAAISLVLCYAYLRQDRSKKIIPIIQFFLGIVGLVPFVLFFFIMSNVPGDVFGNTGLYIYYFFWINILAMIGIPIGALVSYIEIHRQFGVKSDRTRFIKHVIGRKLGYSMSAMMVLVLVVALGYFASVKQVAQPVKAETAEISVAVLPFVNMSNDASNEVFSDGISVDILISLAKVEELQVAGWASASAFRGQDKSIQEIAAALDVDYILEGSVRRVGDRVRITAQVIRGSDVRHVWADSYDRTLDDVPAIQDEIVAAVVAALNEGHGTE